MPIFNPPSAGGGGSSSASDLTSGTLAPARIADGSLTAAKMASDAAPRGYGKLAGRIIRGRAAGRSAVYADVTTAITSTFTDTTIPLAEPFYSTGLQQGTNSVVISTQYPAGWYEVNGAVKFNAGSAGNRNLKVMVNGAPVFNVKTYCAASGSTPIVNTRLFLKPGDIVSLAAYVEVASVTVVADYEGMVYLDVTRLDRPKVQSMIYGWSQTPGETLTVATVPAKQEITNVWLSVNAWTDVNGSTLSSHTVLASYVAANPTGALDIAGPLIPHGLGSGTWDAALDSVTAGTHDSDFTTLGTNLATYGPQTVYYRPWWEFNISSMMPTAAKFIAAWNRAVPLIRTAFAAAAPTKTLKIVWCFSEGADPGPWYPADTAVDIISDDVYAMVYGTTTPTLVSLLIRLNEKLAILGHYGALKNKPIAISEFAQCAIQPGSTSFQGRGDEPVIIDHIFDWFENAGVVYAVYFNWSTGNVGITLTNVPNTAARLEQRRALLSRLG